MNIIAIIIKEIKQNIRDRKATMMMVLFPIVLIIVLGAAFKNNFSGDAIINGTLKVFYKIDAKDQAAEELKSQLIVNGSKYGIDFIKADSIEKAKEQLIQSSDYSAVLEMKEDKKINIYKNDAGSINYRGGIVEVVVSDFVNFYNVTVEIEKVIPQAVKNIDYSKNISHTNIVSINKAKTPSSLDYYAIAEISLIIMYASFSGLNCIASEKNYKTRNRILSSPVSKYEFLAGKTIGIILVTMVQILVVVLFSKVVLKANFGEDILTVLLILFSQVTMAVCLGVSLSFVFRQQTIASAILNFFIPVIVFLGGSYIQVDNMGSNIFNLITYLSPVRWVNKSIMEVIYNNDYSKVLTAIGVNIITGVVFILLATILFRKETA